MTKTSFGEYFDNQRERLEKMMQNKNTELNVQWREDFDNRQSALVLRREKGGVTLPHVDDNTPREELDSWTKITAKATAKGIAAKEAT